MLNVPFPAGVVQLMRNPPSRILLFGVWIWEGEKRLFISNTLIPLIPVGSWLGFPPAERGCERLPGLFAQKYQRAAAPATGCGVGTPHPRALRSPHRGQCCVPSVEVAFGAAEVLQHWPEVSPGLSLWNVQAWPCSGAQSHWETS